MRTILQIVGVLTAFVSFAQATERTPQEASIDFIQTYFQQWSLPNASALAYLDGVFPDRVSYFDEPLDHTSLMKAKRRFAERWPERNFAARTGSLDVTCDERHLCTVWGLVDWTCRSAQRQAYATGTSAFSLQLQDGMVVAEDGFVVSRGRRFVWHPPESPTEAVNLAESSSAAHSSGSAPGPVQTQGAGDTPRNTNVVNQSRGSQHTGNYTNADIPALREAYFAEASDKDWISHWLMVPKRFVGTVRSLGEAGISTLSDSDGANVHMISFASDHGPIACMLPGAVPDIAKGSDVRVQGLVSVFIDQTMYLGHCSFG